MTNPHEWHIVSDRDGFYIENEYGEEIVPNWLPFNAGWRTQSFKTAEEVLHEQISAALDNEEPLDPMRGVEFPFAESH